MIVTFYSNFLNHHQLSFCLEMQRLTRGNFFFVADIPISADRLRLGYEDLNHLPFVIRAYESEKERKRAETLCLKSDFIIHGSASEEYIRMRMKNDKKLAFRYSERWLKDGIWHMFSPRARYFVNRDHGVYRKEPLYMLCASAFAAADLKRFGVYCGKTYKWGYFPEAKRYEDLDGLLAKKETHTLLWAGRYLEWKHPESAILLAADLKRAGYKIRLRMIGTGEKEREIRAMIAAERLEGEVEVLGSMAPERVRAYMEKSEIFLFTSDFNEGWGAVLNEAMNSACAVVASHAIGSVPFLIQNGENGLIYKNKDRKDLFRKVGSLLDDAEKSKKIAKKAYETIVDLWNGETAAQRLMLLAEDLLSEGRSARFSNGPCSAAGFLKNNWFRKQ